jgi:hypothetical protein
MAASYDALSGVPNYAVEPPDQAVCANGQYVMEVLNLGEVQIYGASTLAPVSNGYTTLDSLMGLGNHASGWSSAGDISCLYDANNGGHWFITEIVSTTPETPLVSGGQPGPFQGCFAGVYDTCREGLAVSATNNPLGKYNVYFVDPNKADSGVPGAGYLLNDFAKIGNTRDAFLMFFDTFNFNGATFPACPAYGCEGFDGAQQIAFNKNALEQGLPAKDINAAFENMGNAANLYPIPANGSFQPVPVSCFSGTYAGISCWYAVIPAQSPDPSQFDNNNGGTGFMIASLDAIDPVSNGDNRLAVFDWTHLSGLDGGTGCSGCGGILFGGQILKSPLTYRDLYSGNCLAQYGGICNLGDQKAGTTPLADYCGAAGLTFTQSCPESGVESNGDFAYQASLADGLLWTSFSTVFQQNWGSSSELHLGAIYYAVNTQSFDMWGAFSLTTVGYVSAAHADMEFPVTVGTDSGRAVMAFTLNSNSYYPSTGYGLLSTTSSGLIGNMMYIADMGQAPQDGFTEYLGWPGATGPRWGDYNWAIYDPSLGGVIFATNYIEHPNCGDNAFISSGGTCGGTRTLDANWGSSVNFIATS